MHIRINRRKTYQPGLEWGHGNGRGGVGPQSTSVSLAIIAIYVIKGWYSLTNEAIVKTVG